MPDLLDRIRSEMSIRLAVLRPLVDEQRRLEAALQALGDATSNAPAAPASPAAPTKRRVRKPAAKRRKRAARGAYREAVLRAVKDRPGATSVELASVSGVSATRSTDCWRGSSKAASCRPVRCPAGARGIHSPSRRRRTRQMQHR